MRKQLVILSIIVIFLHAAFLGGYFLNPWLNPKPAPQANASTPAAAQPGEPAATDKNVLYWHDPMFPQQRFDKPGKSPFMDMQLVPVYADAANEAGGVSINPRLTQNLGLRTAPVEMGVFARQVHTVGAVMPDEHRIEVVQSRAAGWVERLHVKAVNEKVVRGQLLAEVYAPEILAAQEEYVLALKHAGSGADPLAQAAHARLSFLGLSEAQIAALEKNQKPLRRVAFYSPINGIVAQLGVRQGMAVTPGTVMFNLVDLSSVWVTAEVVENQGGWIAQGNRAEIRVPAYPGKVFAGRLDYIYPELMAATRTVKARIVLNNPQGLLKPDMFVDVMLDARGRDNTLMVPAEAVIHTGRRSVVIIAEGEGRFRPTDVVTGAESGGKTEILQGLEKGQMVVASGQFLIDSEASLRTSLERLEPPENSSTANDVKQKP
ncbi:MAG: efflux RND transporter periplasmic adaptor subunit [Burkholderiales bacterium]